MIPSTTNKLLVSEDWKKIYQSFKNADFKSYDFETLRRTMIAYLQENYPEDFNDFIDSSEYIALIDLIAYLGQNLSFRIDLNARENFLETAQRRDSILRLAQLISYVPKRNVPASGFLKLTAISTTDSVVDSAGINLANTVIGWNDITNPNWYQQFISILNSSMYGSFVFGKPLDRKTISGILTEQYRINSNNTTDAPIFNFLKNINGTNMSFEAVSATMAGTTSVYEEAPRPGNAFSILYKNDNRGSGSANTGFFVKFTQGSLGASTFSLDTPVPNEIVGINTPDINDTDVWLWQLDSDNTHSTLWDKVPALTGNNVIYNSLTTDKRKIYSVTSRNEDQIDLNFTDGSFGDLPKGKFKLYYRQSNGLTYTISPEQMSGITIPIPYTNKSNQQHTLTLTLSLQYIVGNSSGAETNASIQNKAPQAFYVQNRMVTAEDYNIAPLTASNDILKVKSINRVSSGLSKYFDLTDISGKYSKTNIFATDGIIYKNNQELNFDFEFTNRNEVFAVIKQQIEPILTSPELKSLYYEEYDRLELTDITWTQVNKNPLESRGYFKNSNTPPDPVGLGVYGDGNLAYISAGTLIKFMPPAGKYFTPTGKIVAKQSNTTLNYIWSTVKQVVGDGYNAGMGALDDGTGPVILNNTIDTNAIPAKIIPKYIYTLSYAFENELVNLCMTQRNFGLAINKLTRTWTIVLGTNLDLTHPFNLQFQGNTDNASKDASWIIAFVWTGKYYKVRYRTTTFIFQSEKETSFFIDQTTVNYDFTNNTVVKDQINVLSINTAMVPMNAANTATMGSVGKDYKWQIDSSVTEVDGFIDPTKVKISFYDYNSSGQITDPDSFTNLVEPMTVSPTTGYRENFVYFKLLSDGQQYGIVDNSVVSAYPTPITATNDMSASFVTGDLCYFYDPAFNIVKSYDSSLAYTGDPWVYEPDYTAYPGRSTLKFHYVHNSGEDRRIDPSKSNIIDIYLLTSEYDTTYRNWLLTGIGTEPLPQTSQGLSQNYSSILDPIKTISDELVFQPVKYKVLFGNTANINLQATFKAVKNPSIPVSDNELKANILVAIQDFFNLENWDFGQTFYFSELSTYVMNIMTPNITNFIIVPTINNFGSLYEISCASNEIFINGAAVSNIEIIDAITASQLKTTSLITSTGTK